MLPDFFHPALRAWFEKSLGAPTPAQTRAWPLIAAGRHTLIAAPTGSGKTLAAFFAVLDRLTRESLEGAAGGGTRVVYVSPLKALGNDIHRNLELPLAGIRAELAARSLRAPDIRVAVRTGDTPSAERQRMVKDPPDILITTPESLFLLLTSDGGRRTLRGVRTVIVDEIHAMIDDKRGSHLSLSLERLDALTPAPVQRIGLSATQRPVELVARFLAGEGTGCDVVDEGHRRRLELHLEVPRSPLSAVMSNEIWGELYERTVALIAAHRTTLIFVNTRRLSERLARGLAERIGEENVTAHHGSMSREHRQNAERKLKAGHLKALVATASMELGIDIGSVDLVIQFGSPKSIASFLQRAGRSRHEVGGVPKAVLFPLSREELVEAAALFDAVKRGELDRLAIPRGPLDILAQQIVAETASREWTVDGLYETFRRAFPYRELTKERFLDVVRMLAGGFTTRRGRRGAYLYYDAVNARLRARPGARLAALTNGGAIPDLFDYDVVLQPEGLKVGTLNEDFALESLAGDIFTLGTHSWKLVRVEGLKVFVEDAAGKPPTVPFWLGESAARSDELSAAVSRLRTEIDGLFDEAPLPGPGSADPAAVHPAVRRLVDGIGVPPEAAEQIAGFLWAGRTGLGIMPTRETVVVERFFDEAGDTHIVVHSPYGSRINRAWGLALRKKFCVNFNFELQAAADENSIILSLSSSHSFPLESVFRYLHSNTARETLIQAMLAAPLFEVRWRWNATRSLAVLRNRGGKRVPPPIQRMQADDLIAQVFPDQIACAENLSGPRRIPEHPLVDQVVEDCLHEALDVDGFLQLLRDIESGRVRTVAKDLREPSLFAQEIVNARPYAFLDDVEFAQRRVNAIKNRGWLDPAEARDLGRLDPEAVERVRLDAWPQAETPDELHDALLVHGFVTEEEGSRSGWNRLFEELVHDRRARRVSAAPGRVLWTAAERAASFDAVYRKPGAPDAEALREIVRGRLEALGPVTVERLAGDAALPAAEIGRALSALENEGFVFRGRFTPDLDAEEWCERRLLHRIHRDTIDALRRSIRPVSVADYTRFLFEHQRLYPEIRSGPAALEETLAQLEGFEAPAASWESDLLPSRLSEYDPLWLDFLCTSGRFVWGRFRPAAPEAGKKSGPVRGTPICFVPRVRRPMWRRGALAGPETALSAPAQAVRAVLGSRGASFFDEIAESAKLLPSQARQALGELVNAGLAAGDSFSGLRSLLETGRPPSRSRRPVRYGIEQASRWSLVQPGNGSDGDFEALERAAQAYLERWGVVFRSILDKEALSPRWGALLKVLRRLELRGEVRGGRFVEQVGGEQFARPEIVERLRRVSAAPPDGKLVSVSAADPLNLLGVLVPGPRLARHASNRLAFRDGVPVALLEGKEIRFLREFPGDEQWPIRQVLVRRPGRRARRAAASSSA